MPKLPSLPKRVKGAITNYRVVLLRHKSRAGRHHPMRKRGAVIEVNPNMNRGSMWQAWWHEMVHKWEMECGFSLKDKDGDSDVDRIATAIHADFLRNKWKLPGQ